MSAIEAAGGGISSMLLAICWVRLYTVSVPVLQEFFVQATRPGRFGSLTHEQASTLVESFARYPVQEMTVPVMLAAIESANRFRISLWDAAVIEAARALGCGKMLSEDLNHGRDYGGVIVENPFKRRR